MYAVQIPFLMGNCVLATITFIAQTGKEDLITKKIF